MTTTRQLKAHVWKRDPFDFYVEPLAVSDALFRVEEFRGEVWDPACGQGNVLNAAAAAGLNVIGTDIVQRTKAAFWNGAADFLDETWPAPNIVTNPPFFGGKGAEAFARQALRLAFNKVAIFVDTRFLNGAKRAAGLYREHPPTRVYLISPRPSCPPGEYLAAGGKAQGGTADYCWIVWDMAVAHDMTAATKLRWLNTGAPRT